MKTPMYLLVALLVCACAFGQPPAQTVKSWTIRDYFPGLCSYGDMLTRSDQPSGSNVYQCGYSNNWTAISSAGGGTGTVTATAGSLTSTAVVIGNGGSDLKASTVTIDSSGNLSAPGTMASGDSTTPGAVTIYPQSDATNYFAFSTGSRTNPLKLLMPTADPTAGQVLSCGAPTSNVSTCTWTTPSSGGATTGTIPMPIGGVTAGGVTAGWLGLAGISGKAAGTYWYGLGFANNAEALYNTLLPNDFDPTKSVGVSFWLADGDGNSSMTVTLTIKVACFTTGANQTFATPTWGTTSTASGTMGTNGILVVSATGLNIPAACNNGIPALFDVKRTDGGAGTFAFMGGSASYTRK